MQGTQTTIVMKYLKYDVLMNYEPTEYDRMTNRLGQTVVFYEHPLQGDDAPIIAAFPDHERAVITDFWEQDDMMNPESDYALEIGSKGVSMQYEVKHLLRSKVKRFFEGDQEGLIGAMLLWGFSNEELDWAAEFGYIEYLADDESVVLNKC